MKRITIIFVFLAVTSASLAQPATADYGIKLYHYNKYASAQTILSQFAATDARANYYLGLATLDAGDPAKALQIFQKYPDDAANISGTARVAFANKELSKGASIAKELAGKSSKKDWKPMMYAAEALTYSDGADYNQAIAWYKEITGKKVDDAEVTVGLADAYKRISGSGGAGDAMNNYEHVTGKDPGNSWVFNKIGDLWYAANKPDLSIDGYNKAISADSMNPMPYRGLANDYFWYSNNNERALTYMKKYLQFADRNVSPTSVDDTILYLQILYSSGHYCDAKDMTQKFLQQRPAIVKTKPQFYGILGFSQAGCNDSVNAVNNLRLYFLNMDRKLINANDYVKFGKLWMQLGNLDSAAFYYMKSVSNDTSKNKTEIYRQIAEAYRMKRQWDKAADWYEQLINANPKTQALDYFYRGYCYYNNRLLDKADKAFEDFEKQYPDQPSAIYWQGRSLAAIDSEATTGAAAPPYKRWLDKVGANYDKKNDLMNAYEYLLFYAYNNKNKDDMKTYMDLLRGIAPNDNLIKEIEDQEKSGQKKPKKTK